MEGQCVSRGVVVAAAAAAPAAIFVLPPLVRGGIAPLSLLGLPAALPALTLPSLPPLLPSPPPLQILQTPTAQLILGKEDHLGLLLAALCHDLDHDGHSNSFHVYTQV